MSQRKNISLSKTFLIALCILAGMFTFSSLADAAGTAAGTTIDNQASAAYEDANTNNYTANSNTVTTTVTSVYSVSVTTPADDSGGSNTVVYYPYTVTNTSNASNTFALSTTDGSWTGTLYADDGAGGGTADDGVHQAGETTVTASTGALAADGTYRFFMAVTIPADTADNTTDDTTLNVVGSGDAGAGDDTTDQVTTTADAPDLDIVKRVRNVTDAGAFATTANADPTDTLEYRIEVTNNGSLQATAVVLTDNDHANTTYVAGNLRIGSSATCASNALKTDTAAGDAACAVDECGAASFDGSGNLTAYLGDTADETTGGTLAASSTVYVCFQVTVD